MNAKSLVTLRSKTTTLISEGTQTKFEPNKHYRCIEMKEGDYSEFLVYGVVFSKEAFENLYSNVAVKSDSSSSTSVPLAKSVIESVLKTSISE